MKPFGLARVCHFELACRGLNSDPDLNVFRAFYKLNRCGSWYTFEVRKKNACCYMWITSSLKDWKGRFFLVDDRCVPPEMSWRLKKSRLLDPLPEDFSFNKNLYATLIKEAERVQKYPEHILVMGRISTIWAKPEWYPTLRWNGEAMGLKDALRLKSFDSTKLDVRATKTPKGDPPYLSVVQGHLYQIREPTAPVNQGGSAGQGGSGSVPSIWTVNVSLAQAVALVAGDKGKRIESSGAQGSDSKIILYGSEHLSMEDEGVNVEDEGDGDDAEARPQVSLKRERTTSSKADSNPKTLKKKKLDFKTITLEDDEVDQVTGFSTTGGLLDNLYAHLHGGKTPRDQPVNLPTSPIFLGGRPPRLLKTSTYLIPYLSKKSNLLPRVSPQWGSLLMFRGQALNRLMVGIAPLRSGDAVDVDSAHALEKYIPDWSLANKDRIMDALSAKMALFHLGTPAEHAYYRKMSGPELGNALMLNQAQSNSLVVETYKRWVESESNCGRFERGIASLKNEDNVRSKTKQELSSLRSQVDHLKEQVSKAKGAELERARDRAIKSHQTTIDEVMGMLTRCDGEMVELYALVSELMLTKQWFLTDGVAWAVNTPLKAAKKWSDGLKSGALSFEDLELLIRNLEEKKTKVLPTTQDKWVSLHSSFGLVCWCDDAKLADEFEKLNNINFFLFMSTY
ncbi:hypothetical protein HanOQP8_Chr11g0396101 [Helianthus annuus]|nr:hypothetical protein HanOQP8_Chr11g0396101 [Helianthus annuus]